MPIDRWRGKEVMAHIVNGILLNHKKEQIWVSVELRWMKLESVIQSEASQKEKNKYHILRWILSNIYRRINTYPSETIPENCRGRNTLKFILLIWGHHHPDTKTRQRYYKKKRKLHVNITDEQKHKNPQQNTFKLNPTAH